MAQPCKVLKVKEKTKNGKSSLLGQFAVQGKKFKNVKSEYIRELVTDGEINLKVNDTLGVDAIFKEGDKVMVSGITKGRGFAGVVKRWGFAGGPKTHGQSDRHRAPGSIGQRSDPGRVWKGKKMSGRMGGKTKTIEGLKVFKVDNKNNELWITGIVPGSKGGFINIRKV